MKVGIAAWGPTDVAAGQMPATTRLAGVPMPHSTRRRSKNALKELYMAKHKQRKPSAMGQDGGTGDGQRLKRKQYEKELRRLQTELCKLQDWVKYKGLRVVVVFEGRDAAGKGGTIKAITERVTPRVFRVVALPAPSDREKSQLYMQRYVPHLPAAGEVIIFDRSWYNRAGVEYVLGFCTKEQHRRFLEGCPVFEKYVTDSGIQLIKYWLEVSNGEQRRRFEARINDPLRQWKLSPTDLESRRQWYKYSQARDLMLEATDTPYAPWHIVRSDDKKRARLNCILHLLSLIPYKKVPRDAVKLPKRSDKGAYDDMASLAGGRFIPERF
jgi:polyphosphate kinase